MKKVLSLIMVLVLVLSLSACKDQSNNNSADNGRSTTPSASQPDITSTVSSEQPTVSTEQPTASTPSSTESPYPFAAPIIPDGMSLEPDSFQFALDGNLLSLPILYSDFAALGWTSDDIEGETLKPGYITLGSYSLEKDDANIIRLSFINLGDEELPLSECLVYRFTFSYFSWNAKTSFVLPGGLHIGSTVDDVIAAYGEPTGRSDSTITTKLTYEFGEYNYIEFNIDNDPSVAPYHNSITISREDFSVE
ncbi:MAG: hypothetical protein LBM60_09345 [Clostridium sp.]|jgi:hypothetical protein|nr:hypothetical protein [Clostridium sp.]